LINRTQAAANQPAISSYLTVSTGKQTRSLHWLTARQKPSHVVAALSDEDAIYGQGKAGHAASRHYVVQQPQQLHNAVKRTSSCAS